jgi:hypothetical protein
MTLNGCTEDRQTQAKEIPPATAESNITITTPKSLADVPSAKPKKHIRVYSHKGGSRLSYTKMRETTECILDELPNVRAVSHFTDLILETLIVESNLGEATYHHAAKHWRNYGMGQFTLASARDTVNWVKKNHPDTYKVMMRYYNRKQSMAQNVTTNVPFTIALVSQYYLQRTRGKIGREHLGTIAQRGVVWNHVYNTAKGSGTPRVYLQRVHSYYKRHHVTRIK